jgi:hypothetical protein
LFTTNKGGEGVRGRSRRTSGEKHALYDMRTSACKILQGVGQNFPKKIDSMLDGPNSWLLALGSLDLAFAPVASAKNKGLAGKLIIILLVPFYSQRSQFLGIWTK